MPRIDLDEFVQSIAEKCGLELSINHYYFNKEGDEIITHYELKDFIIEKFMEFAKNE